jgi:hypothetical protein
MSEYQQHYVSTDDPPSVTAESLPVAPKNSESGRYAIAIAKEFQIYAWKHIHEKAVPIPTRPRTDGVIDEVYSLFP